MPRPLTARMGAALRAGAPICLLAVIDHPNGTQRYWTGIGPLDYAGGTYIGLGKFGGVAPVRYSNDVAIQELSFTLAGIPPNAMTWIAQDVRNRLADVWLAALDQYGAIVPDPYKIVSSALDYQSMAADNDGTVTLTLTARSGFYSLERALDEVHSTEDQKRTYPATDDGGDSGLDMIAELQKQEVIWQPS